MAVSESALKHAETYKKPWKLSDYSRGQELHSKCHKEMLTWEAHKFSFGIF